MNDLQFEAFDLIESTLPHDQLYYMSGVLVPSVARRSLPPPVQWDRERRRIAACLPRSEEEDSRAAAARAAKEKKKKQQQEEEGQLLSLATRIATFQPPPRGRGSHILQRSPRTCLGCGRQMSECNGAKGGRVGGKGNCQHKCPGCGVGPLLCRCRGKENGGRRGLCSLVGLGSGEEEDDDYSDVDDSDNPSPPTKKRRRATAPAKKKRARLCRQCGKTAGECVGAKHLKGAYQRCSFRCPGCGLGPLLCTCPSRQRHAPSTTGSTSAIPSPAVLATSTNTSSYAVA
jgi:hypothetical protein